LSSPKSVVQPQRALVAVGVPARVELRQRRLGVPFLDQGALREPGVHDDAEAPQGLAHLVDHQRDAAVADRREVVRVDPLGGDRLSQRDHVVAFVAALGEVLALHPGADRFGELRDLRPGVVDVVLALDLVADCGEQAHHRVAVGRAATAADVQRAGRVGGDELDQDPFRLRRRGRPEFLPRADQPGQGAPVPGVGEEEVDEAGPRDLDPIEVPRGAAEAPFELAAEALGDGARVVAERPGEQHRRIGAVIAEVGLGRTVEGRGRLGGLAVAQRPRGGLDGTLQLGDGIGGRHRPIVSVGSG